MNAWAISAHKTLPSHTERLKWMAATKVQKKKEYAVPKYENKFSVEKFGENDLETMNKNIFIKKYFAYLSCFKG